MTQIPAAERCAVRSLAVHEPMAGTADHVRAGYLMIEDPGPWGRGGITDCGLGERGERLSAAAKRAGVKALVFRAPHRAGRAITGRRVFAVTHGHRPRVVGARVTDDRELDHLDLSAYDGDLAEVHTTAVEVARPLLFVCTHARRDQCCAIEGRPLAQALQREQPGQVFECSHLGGHRFAPTALMLPAGAVYGRLDARTARRALRLAARGEVVVEALRGLSHLPARAQSADIALRRQLGAPDVDAVRLVGADPTGGVLLDAAGTRWRAEVVERRNPPRPASCGKEPSPSESFVTLGVRPAD
ncbi:sucrase ferredoxin [Cumulibacter manganitolerans]|uniref:sucrase ferredoxin n=1 Tax=Cumulibacter manganitolerans TaxID=1884992 RepID=UPI0012957B68|nr:sucrase ferredoxin [Cumulibacter manganitolerans]